MVAISFIFSVILRNEKQVGFRNSLIFTPQWKFRLVVNSLTYNVMDTFSGWWCHVRAPPWTGLLECWLTEPWKWCRAGRSRAPWQGESERSAPLLLLVFRLKLGPVNQQPWPPGLHWRHGKVRTSHRHAKLKTLASYKLNSIL